MPIEVVTHLDDGVLRGHFEDAGQPLDQARVFAALGGRAVRRQLTSALAAAPFEAFFWECAPAARHLRGRFAFVVIDSPALARVTADPEPFAAHFAGGGTPTIRTFGNLGGRSLLIAPSDIGPAGAHLARFVRQGPPDLVDALWSAVPAAVDRWFATGARRLWLSTSGLGVHWLHLRLDPRPKYYTWAPFRDMTG